MAIVHQHKRIKTGSLASRVQFEIGNGNRYLLLDGKRAYDLGFGGCDTCSFLFERLGGANQPVQIEACAEALSMGVESLDQPVVDVIGATMPPAEYTVLLAEASVLQVQPGSSYDYFLNEQMTLWGEDTFWCLPHDPRVSYFRAGDYDFGQGRRLFNFIVPMIPTKWLSMTTLAVYKEALRTKASGTAVSIALLDVRSPVSWQGDKERDVYEHWCLTHYLLDGHHKLNAASESNKPLSLLSFVGLVPGVCTQQNIDDVIGFMSKGH